MVLQLWMYTSMMFSVAMFCYYWAHYYMDKKEHEEE
eukprot:CAMPEP_0176350584 /NCGR_PEP_ID=MMETSP0126-20121128/9594_1 /TAXON_ID=141414 ORGANISM="Strombidinopsis acuminatum, Strain SPMC142" /NCGR_SAMPLE_ID=MMETSP0126 /ASSEMBLY_ACC=CAM_ASM_000229 /LENGTH=35 /DNA_ID= /DNA_START= /DNA_END= /DNA_ORIENTATION=